MHCDSYETGNSCVRLPFLCVLVTTPNLTRFFSKTTVLIHYAHCHTITSRFPSQFKETRRDETRRAVVFFFSDAPRQTFNSSTVLTNRTGEGNSHQAPYLARAKVLHRLHLMLLCGALTFTFPFFNTGCTQYIFSVCLQCILSRIRPEPYWLPSIHLFGALTVHLQ